MEETTNFSSIINFEHSECWFTERPELQGRSMQRSNESENVPGEKTRYELYLVGSASKESLLVLNPKGSTVQNRAGTCPKCPQPDSHITSCLNITNWVIKEIISLKMNLKIRTIKIRMIKNIKNCLCSFKRSVCSFIRMTT